MQAGDKIEVSGIGECLIGVIIVRAQIGGRPMYFAVKKDEAGWSKAHSGEILPTDTLADIARKV